MLDLYQRVIEFTQDGVYRYDFETGMLLFANQGLVNILDLDLKPEELPGKYLRDLLVYTEKEGTVRHMLEEHGEIHQFEYHFRTLKGEDRWVLHDSFVVTDPKTGRRIIEAIARNITERRLSEERTRQEREWFEVTLRSIGDGTIATDARGRVVLMNPVAEALTGWTFAEAQMQPLAGVFNIFNAYSREAAENPVDRVLREGKVVGLANHTILLSRNGHEYQIADSAAPIFDREQKIIGVILVFQDVTEEYRLQEKLLQQQKMEVLGNLAGGVAHDFNNMLTGILGFSGLLESKLADNPTLQGFAREIMRAGQSAAELTHKLLTFSRKTQFQGQPLNVHETITNVVGILQRTIDRKINISTRLQADPAVISGDLTLLQNAVLNLALNARDAMPEGGELMFATANMYLDDEFCFKHATSLRPGPYIEIDIKDTGLGMTREQLDHAFEPFFTTKAVGRGTGLGLSVVFGTIRHHNGWVTVYSQPGMGTLVKIYLPSTNAAVIAKSGVSSLVMGSGLILVVDDEPIIRATTQALLVELGYEVILAEDGEQALEIYSKEKSRIRLVLLDMVMPKLSGSETFERLKAIDPHVRVAFCSGFVPGGGIEGLLSAGAVGFVAKPFSMQTLSEELHKILEKL